MSSNISIADDVYEFLKQQKSEKNTSFSQVIRELKEKADKEKGSYNNVMKLYGRFKDLNVDYKEMDDLRNEFEERL